MAYRDMNPYYYVISVLAFYSCQVGVSLLVDDISIMFDFVSAFAVSFYAFIYPAIFFDLAVKKYGPGKNKCDHYWAKSFYFIGTLNFCLGLFSAIEGIVTHGDE